MLVSTDDKTSIYEVFYGKRNAQYDLNAKRLLSARKILAEIVQRVVPECEGFTTDYIANECIEGEPDVGTIPLAPGLTNAKPADKPDNIIGNRNEDGDFTEGYVTYDILFRLRIPQSGEMITLIVNVEPQRTHNPIKLDYHLICRAVFYVARMISSQKNRDFQGSDYDSINKVYSIWICMDSPIKDSSINLYSLKEKHLLHKYVENKRLYDLMDIVMIYLGDRADKDRLVQLLRILFKEHGMSAAQKKDIVEKEYGINLTPEMEEEMTKMCNLSIGIAEEAYGNGYGNGYDKANYEAAERFLAMGLSPEQVAKGTDMPLNTVEELLKKLKKND